MLVVDRDRQDEQERQLSKVDEQYLAGGTGGRDHDGDENTGVIIGLTQAFRERETVRGRGQSTDGLGALVVYLPCSSVSARQASSWSWFIEMYVVLEGLIRRSLSWYGQNFEAQQKVSCSLDSSHCSPS